MQFFKVKEKTGNFDFESKKNLRIWKKSWKSETSCALYVTYWKHKSMGRKAD